MKTFEIVSLGNINNGVCFIVLGYSTAVSGVILLTCWSGASPANGISIKFVIG